MDYKKFLLQIPDIFHNWKTSLCSPKSDVFQDISAKINSMISPNVMQLLNFAVSCLDENEVYCDIGTFQGGSLISALIDNPTNIAYAVDNFSDLDTKDDNFDKLSSNLEEFNLADQVFFCYQDSEEFLQEFNNQEITDKIGVLFYDGSQNYRSYLLNLLHLVPIISNQSLIVITNCQWQSCQQAVRDFLATNSEAKLILDFANEDYLLWNGIQILVWDNHSQTDNDVEDKYTVDFSFQKSISHITEVESIQFIDAMTYKASTLLQNQQYLEAETLYLNLLALNRNNTNANILYNLGNLYYQIGKYFKALDCLNEVLIIDPSQSLYHYTIGLVLEKIDTNQSIVAYKKTIEIAPNLVDAYINLGNVLLLQGRTEEAERQFTNVINIKPFYIAGYINLGNLFLQKYQKKYEAISFYKQALILSPNNVDILDNLSMV